MSRWNPETLNLAMDYAAVMESCAAYVTVRRPKTRTPQDAERILRPLISAATDGNKQESFWIILLDAKNQMIGIPREATRGLVDTSLVHPRETFREAVRSGAAGVVLAHNHPSGDPTPSKEDIEVTKRIVMAGQILGIRVMDHLILGQKTDTSDGWVSLREKNLVNFDAK